jgi:hypothetical protein
MHNASLNTARAAEQKMEKRRFEKVMLKKMPTRAMSLAPENRLQEM